MRHFVQQKYPIDPVIILNFCLKEYQYRLSECVFLAREQSIPFYSDEFVSTKNGIESSEQLTYPFSKFFLTFIHFFRSIRRLASYFDLAEVVKW